MKIIFILNKPLLMRCEHCLSPHASFYCGHKDCDTVYCGQECANDHFVHHVVHCAASMELVGLPPRKRARERPIVCDDTFNKFKSKEGRIIFLPESKARRSATLSQLIDEVGPNRVINVPQINTDTLGRIARLLREDGNSLSDILSAPLTVAQYVNFVQGYLYLAIENVKDETALMYQFTQDYRPDTFAYAFSREPKDWVKFVPLVGATPMDNFIPGGSALYEFSSIVWPTTPKNAINDMASNLTDLPSSFLGTALLAMAKDLPPHMRMALIGMHPNFFDAVKSAVVNIERTGGGPDVQHLTDGQIIDIRLNTMMQVDSKQLMTRENAMEFFDLDKFDMRFVPKIKDGKTKRTDRFNFFDLLKRAMEKHRSIPAILEARNDRKRRVEDRYTVRKEPQDTSIERFNRWIKLVSSIKDGRYVPTAAVSYILLRIPGTSDISVNNIRMSNPDVQRAIEEFELHVAMLQSRGDRSANRYMWETVFQ